MRNGGSGKIVPCRNHVARKQWGCIAQTQVLTAPKLMFLPSYSRVVELGQRIEMMEVDFAQIN